MMNMLSKNQYLQTLIQEKGYHLLSKKDKGRLLDQYCNNTGLNRKYVVRKIRTGGFLKDKSVKITRKRKKVYDSRVKMALIRCWEIFNYPCGQRLKPLLETETDTLRRQKELECSLETTKKLKMIFNQRKRGNLD